MKVLADIMGNGLPRPGGGKANQEGKGAAAHRARGGFLFMKSRLRRSPRTGALGLPSSELEQNLL